MSRTNLAKVEVYKNMIGLVTDLIEEHTGSKLETLDPLIGDRLERALEFGNIKELKDIHLRLDEMLGNVRKKGIYALK